MKKLWWKHSVIYHIYIRSFFDSNNDGIGDIQGVIQKLDYLKEIGIGAIWLSPFYESPNVDYGYDVSNYKSVSPEYGTLNDFKKLLKQAHLLDIKIIVDMVFNHTSNQHPWFLESSSSIDNPKRDWYIWKKGTKWRLPNNWRTTFGKKAWQYDKNTQEYYYHSFFKEQPDLNWRNKQVQEAMFEQVQFWLYIGVDGFRLDVINFIVKDKHFRNNPNLISRLLFSKEVYTRNRYKSIKILHKLRKLLDSYPDVMTVGEIFTLPPGNSKIVGQYLGQEKSALHLAFDFSLIFTKWNVKSIERSLLESHLHLPEKSWPSIVLSNHDLNRSFSRPFRSRNKLEKAKLKFLMMFTLHGTPFVYYGEEIGMEDTHIPKAMIKDKLGKMFWPFYKGRDKCRTPMQWNDTVFAGFSHHVPWLPVNNNFKKTNVEVQRSDEKSLFNFLKKIVHFRESNKILRNGKWELCDFRNKNVLSYRRYSKKDSLIILLNFSGKEQSLYFDANFEVLFSIYNEYIVFPNKVVLKAFEGVVIRPEKL